MKSLHLQIIRFLLCVTFTVTLPLFCYILLTTEASHLINQVGIFLIALFGAILMTENL